MDVKKIGFLGGRGYVGQEIFKVLSKHELLNIATVFSSSKSGQQVNQNMSKSLVYQDLNIDKIKFTDEDAFILALPDNQSQPYIDLIHRHNPKAIIVAIAIAAAFID